MKPSYYACATLSVADLSTSAFRSVAASSVGRFGLGGFLEHIAEAGIGPFVSSAHRIICRESGSQVVNYS